MVHPIIFFERPDLNPDVEFYWQKPDLTFTLRLVIIFENYLAAGTADDEKQLYIWIKKTLTSLYLKVCLKTKMSFLMNIIPPKKEACVFNILPGNLNFHSQSQSLLTFYHPPYHRGTSHSFFCQSHFLQPPKAIFFLFSQPIVRVCLRPFRVLPVT